MRTMKSYSALFLPFCIPMIVVTGVGTFFGWLLNIFIVLQPFRALGMFAIIE